MEGKANFSLYVKSLPFPFATDGGDIARRYRRYRQKGGIFHSKLMLYQIKNALLSYIVRYLVLSQKMMKYLMLIHKWLKWSKFSKKALLAPFLDSFPSPPQKMYKSSALSATELCLLALWSHPFSRSVPYSSPVSNILLST